MEHIIKCLASVGLCTVSLIIYMYIAYFIIPKIKEIMKRQNKIRFLCNHEYVETFYWEDKEKHGYSLKCRKCGKRKKFNIYKEKCNIDKL